jgi:methionine-rich copper-binding protein CopC
MRPALLIAIAVLAYALPAPAQAKVMLLSSSPAANAALAKPTKLTLSFSERLVEGASGVDLVMTGMPGMADHPPMPVKGFKTSIAPDGKTMLLTLPRPLPAGSYDLSWRAAGADQQRAEGRFSFKVR